MTRRDYLLFFLPLAVILTLFLIWPAAFGFMASFTDYAPAQLQTKFVGLQNYANVVQNTEFNAALGNLVVYGSVSVFAELVIGFVVAYLLRSRFCGLAWLRVTLLIPWLLSPVANGVMWHFLFSSQRGVFGFVFSWLCSAQLPSPLGVPSLALPAAILTEIWRKAPLVSFLLVPGMLSIPEEQWEHATLEGASTLDAVRHIALPWLRPLLLTIALLLIGDSLGTFENILVMTGGGPGSRTLMLGLYSYQQAFARDNWPIGATSAWLIVAATILVGAAYLKLDRDQAANDSSFHLAWSNRLHLPQLPSLAISRLSWQAQRRIHRVLAGILLALIVVLSLLPILWTLLASFNIKPENGVSPPRWEIAASLDYYLEVGVTEPGFSQELITSIALALATTIIGIAIASLAAYGISRSRWRSKKLLVQSFLIMASLPVMAYAIPLNATARSLRLYDTFIGVTLAEAAVLSPLATYILFGYFARISPEVEEAAFLDGANLFQVLWSVVLPIAAAGIGATAIILFVLSWNQFLVPFDLSTDSVRSIPMAMVDVFKWDRELEWSAVAAAIIVSLLPLVVLVAAATRLLNQFIITTTDQLS